MSQALYLKRISQEHTFGLIVTPYIYTYEHNHARRCTHARKHTRTHARTRAHINTTCVHTHTRCQP